MQETERLPRPSPNKRPSIAHNFQISNRTSTHFLGGSRTQRSWMNGGPSESHYVRPSETTVPISAHATLLESVQHAPALAEPDQATDLPQRSDTVLPKPASIPRPPKRPREEDNLNLRGRVGREQNTASYNANVMLHTSHLLTDSESIHIVSDQEPSANLNVVRPPTEQRDKVSQSSGLAYAARSPFRPTNITPEIQRVGVEQTLPNQNDPIPKLPNVREPVLLPQNPSVSSIAMNEQAQLRTPVASPVSIERRNKRPNSSVDLAIQSQTTPPTSIESFTEPIRSCVAGTTSSILATSPAIPAANIVNSAQRQSTPDAHSPPHVTWSVHLARFDTVVSHISTRCIFNNSARVRLTWLREACLANDHWFLLLHQLSILWTLQDPIMVAKLGFGTPHVGGFKLLDLLLHSNSDLPQDLLGFLANFPHLSRTLGPSSETNQAQYQDLHRQVHTLNHFLVGLNARWQNLRTACFKRRYPPTPADVFVHLSCPSSTTLPQIFFNSLDRQLNPHGDNAWQLEAHNLFTRQCQKYTTYMRHRDPIYQIGAELHQANKHFEFVYRQLEARMGRTPSAQTGQVSRSNNSSAHQFWNTIGTLSAQPNQSQMPNNRPLSSVESLTQALTHAQRGPSTRSIQPLTQTSPPPGRLQTSITTSQPQQQRGTPPHTSQQHGPRIVGQVVNSHIGNRTSSAMQPSGMLSYDALPAARKQNFPKVPLLPLSGYIPPIMANPDPLRMALHQAHLRGPLYRRAGQAHPDNTSRMYQYVDRFLLDPQLVDPKSSFFNYNFEVPADLLARKANDELPQDGDVFGHSQRLVDNRSLIFSVRCVEVPEGASLEFTTAWAERPTTWPKHCFISVNDRQLEFRRKYQYKKDLHVDVTSFIRPDQNVIAMSMHATDEEIDRVFALAVEVIEINDTETVTSMPSLITAKESLLSITKSLKLGDEEDEIVLLDPHISIDLIDPFTSLPVQTPVRGRTCIHRECFDLGAYLQSRLSYNQGILSSVDQWHCPLCKRDARPKSLVLDGFLVQVGDELMKSGRNTARAITVREDGTWEPKFESEKSQGGSEKHSTKAVVPQAGIDGCESKGLDIMSRAQKGLKEGDDVLDATHAVVVIDLGDDE